jgi:hypothetical protein
VERFLEDFFIDAVTLFLALIEADHSGEVGDEVLHAAPLTPHSSGEATLMTQHQRHGRRPRVTKVIVEVLIAELEWSFGVGGPATWSLVVVLHGEGEGLKGRVLALELARATGAALTRASHTGPRLPRGERQGRAGGRHRPSDLRPLRATGT